MPNDWRVFYLVTSDTHIARAMYIFEHTLGPAYTILPVPSPSLLSETDRAKRQELETLYMADNAKLYQHICPGDLDALRRKIEGMRDEG